MYYWLIGLLLLALSACQSGKPTATDPLFEKLPAEKTHIDFANTVTDDKDFNIFNYRNFYNGGGVAIGDVNGDELPDVFLIANVGDNKLYINRTVPGKGGMQFDDITPKAGVAGKHSWSTGATFADVNGDGRLDLYVCNAGTRDGDNRANELYINNGNGPDGIPTFTEKAHEYGLDDPGFSTHAAFFDYDRDGDLDMYLLNNSFLPVGRLQYANIRDQRDSLGGQKLFRNMMVEERKVGKEERKKEFKETPSSSSPSSFPPVFVDVSAKAGIYGSLIGFGLGLTIGDMNDDNWLDIYISNDFYERDYLYLNNHDGTFRESIKEAMPHTSLSSMGADVADINNDGRLDVFVTDMLPGNDSRLKRNSTFESYELQQIKLDRDFHYQIMQNMLHLNEGPMPGKNPAEQAIPHFSEIARFSGVHATDWSWGALIFDMDNDGMKDIFVANGIAKDVTDQDFVNFLADRENMAQIARQRSFNFKDFLDKAPYEPIPNYAFRNEGNLNFKNVATDWGLGEASFSNGAAYGDLDNDGDLDLIVNNVNAPVSVYQNLSEEKYKSNYLKIKLHGSDQNLNAIGTRVFLYQSNATGKVQMQVLQQMPNRGFESSVDLNLLFGLGNNAKIDSIKVIWPNDRMQVIQHPNANQVLTLSEKNATGIWKPTPLPTNQPFEDITGSSGLNFVHHESNFVDYNRDPLLKQMLSTLGPALATGDVNGDGLDDVFLGGASGQGGKLYIQQAGNRFVDKTPVAISQATTYEATDAVFFDADGDKDLDLYVVSGSNEYMPEADELLDRFYRNDGKGNFTADLNLPNLKAVGSCVAAGDFDLDGDMDLFVGSRVIPGAYGRSPASYLLTNDGTGNFKNFTKRSLPEADQLGMVTGAAWADLNGDHYPELVVSTDWGPIMVFDNQHGRLSYDPNRVVTNDKGEPIKTGGWWNCITAADIDSDGDLDLIAGNLGLNSRIKATQALPAELYVNDFDNNGTVEQVINCADETGQLYPMLLKQDFQKAMPTIKKKYVKYTEYAGKKIDQLIDEDALKKAVKRTAYIGESAIFINNGKGQFTYMPLPYEAQFSPICSILLADYDHDGKKDLVLAGNFFDVLPEIGRYDANYGLVLRNQGKGKNGLPAFAVIQPLQSGFYTQGQVRRARITNQNQFILAKNNAQAQVFALRPVQQ